MPTVTKSALVKHSAEQMFALVSDVDAYQQFLPWCAESRRIEGPDGELCGELMVARAGIRQSFSTCNRLYPFERMEIRLREGPFRDLHGAWNFTALRADACKVELELHFQFSGALINLAFGTVFRQIADSLVDAFVKRADEVYGDA